MRRVSGYWMMSVSVGDGTCVGMIAGLMRPYLPSACIVNYDFRDTLVYAGFFFKAMVYLSFNYSVRALSVPVNMWMLGVSWPPELRRWMLAPGRSAPPNSVILSRLNTSPCHLISDITTPALLFRIHRAPNRPIAPSPHRRIPLRSLRNHPVVRIQQE